MEISYRPEKPSILIARVINLQNAQGKQISAHSSMLGIACSPEKLTPVRSAPEDFVQFWQKARAKSKKLTVSSKPFADNFYPKHRAFLLSVAVDGDTFQSILIIPKKIQKKLPLRVSLPGAGSGIGKPWVSSQDNTVGLHINVHRTPWSTDAKIRAQNLKDTEKKFGMPYFCYGAEKPENYFYYKTIIAACAFTDYAFSIPECDGINLGVMGSSQGGFLAAALTAVHGKVSAVSINVPAMCDHFGHLAGRQSGWPQLLTRRKDAAVTAGYYDAVNFAAQIDVPALVSVGFLDTTAPAAVGYIL